jgi:hypothetical protein
MGVRWYSFKSAPLDAPVEIHQLSWLPRLVPGCGYPLCDQSGEVYTNLKTAGEEEGLKTAETIRSSISKS